MPGVEVLKSEVGVLCSSFLLVVWINSCGVIGPRAWTSRALDYLGDYLSLCDVIIAFQERW